MIETSTVDGIAQLEVWPLTGEPGERADDLSERVLELDRDESVRVIVISGADARSFASSSDPEFEVALRDGGSIGSGAPVVGEFYPRFADTYRFSQAALQQFGRWMRLETPVVSAVCGDAVAHGLTQLLFLSDVLILESQARLRDVHVNGGMSTTGSFLWPLTMGIARARPPLLTGRWLSATEAEEAGLVSEVVPTGEAKARAWEYARHLAALPARAVQETKRALQSWFLVNEAAVFHRVLLGEITLHGHRADHEDRHLPPQVVLSRDVESRRS